MLILTSMFQLLISPKIKTLKKNDFAKISHWKLPLAMQFHVLCVSHFCVREHVCLGFDWNHFRMNYAQINASLSIFSNWIKIVFSLRNTEFYNWTASSEFGTYRLCEQRRFRRACASAQSRQNLRCSLIQAGSQEEPSDRKPDPWPLRIAGHAQLKFVMTECSKTQIRLTGLKWCIFQAAQRKRKFLCLEFLWNYSLP